MPFLPLLENINQVLWGPIMLLVLIGLGLYLSLRLGFFQLTRPKLIFQKTFGAMFSKKPPSVGASFFSS